MISSSLSRKIVSLNELSFLLCNSRYILRFWYFYINLQMAQGIEQNIDVKQLMSSFSLMKFDPIVKMDIMMFQNNLYNKISKNNFKSSCNEFRSIKPQNLIKILSKIQTIFLEFEIWYDCLTLKLLNDQNLVDFILSTSIIFIHLQFFILSFFDVAY